MSHGAWPAAPASAALASGPAFGRYLGPVPTLNLRAPRMRTKRWHYLSVNAPHAFMAMGLVQLGYAAQLFVYRVDKRSGQREQFEALSPLGLALHMAAGPCEGITRWRGRDAYVDVHGGGKDWVVSLDVPLGGAYLSGHLRLPQGDGLSLLFDLGQQRPAYTYKVADVQVEGRLTHGDQELSLEGARGTADWTWSHALRHTRWHWASATGVAVNGTRLGLNLSQHVYDRDGISQENVVWVDGQPRAVGAVALEPPDDPSRQRWSLRSVEDGAVQLAFVPQGAREDRQHLGLVRSDFTQAVGSFRGRLCGYDVADLYGVMERHVARW